jgi:Ca2+/H+ antiporter, TMEM165/GDT1 family
MTNWTTLISVVGASFLASFVEVVEAFTIVLAVGIIRGWKSAILGTVAALTVLALIVITMAPLLLQVPLRLLQAVIGILLLLFGLRWLRKAILRAIGAIPLHDEEAAFASETQELGGTGARTTSRLDWIAGITAFKAVLLEGVEVVFIIIAVGSARGLLWEASLGALAACLLVLPIGLLVHKPLSQVPENTLKFAVGVVLSAFGLFWTGEGFGIDWPGADAAILAFAALFLIIAVALVTWFRSQRLEPA